MADDTLTPDGVQSLDDDLLDSVVGGAALPSCFDQYVNSRGGITLSRSFTDGSTSGAGKTAVKADTVQLSRYLDRLESRGYTEVGLVRADGKTQDMFSIAQVRQMIAG